MDNELQKVDERAKEAHVDRLKFLYYEMKDRITNETDVLSIDITDIFWESLFDKLDNNEIIVINCTGEVTTGKSTVVALIRFILNEYIKEKSYTTRPIIPRETFYMDETEFISSITTLTKNKKKEDKIFIQIDDRNSMGEGYLNATTDKQLFDTFSDMFAQQNISRGYCSPSDSPDKNALIWLEVIGKNRKEGTTTCKLMYNNVMEHQQITLGRVTFDVKPLLQEPWYLEERKRKFERHELIHTHGVRDIRDLLFAPIVVQSFEKLRRMAVAGKVSKDLLVATVEDVARENKRFLSQLTLANMCMRVGSLVTLVTEMNTTERKLTKELRNKAATEDDITILKEKLEDLRGMYNRRIGEEKRLEDLYEKYRSI